MTDAFENQLQTDLQRLTPRALSDGLDDRILRELEAAAPAGAMPIRRSLSPAASALVAFAAMAAAVAALAVWLPRQQPKPVEVARQQPAADAKTPPAGSRGGQSAPPRIDAEEDDRRDVRVLHGANQEAINHVQANVQNAKSQGQVGQASHRAGEKAQAGGAKVGGFQSSTLADIEDSRDSGASAVKTTWQRVIEGRLVDVDAERTLYERPEDKRFFIHVRITNKTDRPLRVELNEASVVYPNQWGVHRVDHREVIDERRVEFTALSDEKKTELTDAFAAKKLFEIRPKQSLTYVRAFKGKNCREESSAETGFLIISLDGRLLVTDGREVDDVRCNWFPDAPGGSDLVIPCPVVWKRVPPMEIIVEDD